MPRLVATGAAVLLLAGIACSETEPLTDRVRIPDDEGIATEMTLDRMELEGERVHPISSGVESFRTRSHQVTSLLFWEGKYVHVGLDGEEVAWIAGIGAVIDADPTLVRYSGVFVEVDEDTGRAVFDDGTTLALADGVELPEAGREVAATIDPSAHVVTEFIG